MQLKKYLKEASILEFDNSAYFSGPCALGVMLIHANFRITRSFESCLLSKLNFKKLSD